MNSNWIINLAFNCPLIKYGVNLNWFNFIEMVESNKNLQQHIMRMDKSWFIQSRTGNIKDHYFFEKKLGSGGYGAVYLAKHKLTGM